MSQIGVLANSMGNSPKRRGRSLPGRGQRKKKQCNVRYSVQKVGISGFTHLAPTLDWAPTLHHHQNQYPAHKVSERGQSLQIPKKKMEMGNGGGI